MQVVATKVEDTEEVEETSKIVDDKDILALLDAEKQASVGFENGETLATKREKSLAYSKGEMSDVPSLPNRSSAQTSDINDAIETVLPDLMEIFTGGEDVASFRPVGGEDEEGAKQETDYVRHVAFEQLPAFKILYTAMKDALQVDTGIIETYWQDDEELEQESVEGITAIQMQEAQKSGYDVVAGEPVAPGPDDVPLFNATFERTVDNGKVVSEPIDPNNFTISADAVDIETATYCAIRTYPRAQKLIDAGFAADKVEQLEGISTKNTENETDHARDQADEHSSTTLSSGGGVNDKNGKSLNRSVEVHKHFLRADLDGNGKSKLWRIQTDSALKVILDKEQIDRHGVSAGSPFMTAHRFYGRSLAELLQEIQRIKTALLRMMLDSGYFAMNQRTEVAMDKANEHTLKDLMRNEPMSPVRTKSAGAIRPLQAGQLGFDPQSALEYTSTMAESRSGVVRNAQGLNPDTLHDTKGGAEKLMNMAQKRIRMIARVLAETLVKGWLLDIHHLTRKHGTRAQKMRLRGKWIDVDPTSFGDRSDMTVEVGVGSGGTEQELAVMDRIIALQNNFLALQAKGVLKKPLVDERKMFRAVTKFASRAGQKAPEQFFIDPDAPPEMQEEQPQQEGPSPEQQAMAVQVQMEQQKFAMKMQAEQQKFQQQQELDTQKAKAAHQLKEQEMVLEEQRKRQQMQLEDQLARDRIKMEVELGAYKMQLEQAIAANGGVPASSDGFQDGGSLYK